MSRPVQLGTRLPFAPKPAPHREAGRLLLAKASLLLAGLACASPRVSACSVLPTPLGAHAGQHAPGYLGIEFHEVTATSFGLLHFHTSHQIEVIMVDHDGPAGKAGLRPHDIVLSLNGQPLSSAESLRRMIHEAVPGTSITLSVLRSGHALPITAQIEDREDVERRAWAHVTTGDTPSSDARAVEGTSTLPLTAGTTSGATHGKHFFGEILRGPYTGLQLQVMTPQLGGFFGAPAKMGLLVQAVEPGSPAAISGLEAGDVLLRADALTLRTLNDWGHKLHAAKGRAVRLAILRDHVELNLVLQPESGHSALVWPKLF